MRRPPGRAAAAAAHSIVLVYALACYAVSAAGPRAGHVVGWGMVALSPVNPPASLLKNSSVTQIAAAAEHAVALLSDGRIIAWGETAFNLTKVPITDPKDPPVAVSTGRWHSLVALKSGRVLCWGDNSYGQCTVPKNLVNVTKVAAGSTHSLALVRNGSTTSVVGWGSNIYGETDIPDEARNNVIDIAAGRVFSMAVRAGGEIPGQVLQWGFHPDAPTIRDVKAVTAGNGFAMGIRRDNSLVAWTLDPIALIITPPSLSSRVKSIQANLMGTNGMVLMQSGKAVAVELCNGSSLFSQLCIGPRVPKQVTQNVTSVAAGDGFYLALLPNKT